MTDLRVISGETVRDKAATEVSSRFAQTCDEAVTSGRRMSGFVVVVFDDLGMPYCQWHLGDYFPLPPTTLPEIVKNCVHSRVYA